MRRLSREDQERLYAKEVGGEALERQKRAKETADRRRRGACTCGAQVKRPGAHHGDDCPKRYA